MERMREREHRIARIPLLSVIGGKLESSSATLFLTEADSEYSGETVSIFAETLRDSTAGPGTCARAVVEGCSESKQSVKRERGLQRSVSNHV